MMLEPIEETMVRIRFAGTVESQTFHMAAGECSRLHADWKLYLTGAGPQGNEYVSKQGEKDVLICLNFAQITYTEPGKAY